MKVNDRGPKVPDAPMSLIPRVEGLLPRRRTPSQPGRRDYFRPATARDWSSSSSSSPPLAITVNASR